MLAVDSKYRRNGIGKENIISLKECVSYFLYFEAEDLNVHMWKGA